MLYIIGAGGHAKVVLDIALKEYDVELVDDNVAQWGSYIMGVEIQGPTARVLEDPDAFAVLAIGDLYVRERMIKNATCRFATLLHHQAYVHPSARIGKGTVVVVGAVVQPDVSTGRHCIINTGASVDHDCELGQNVHVAPGARLAGNVIVGSDVLIGMGAMVLPGVRIGHDVVIGAGAVVTKNIPDGITVAGVPARRVK